MNNELKENKIKKAKNSVKPFVYNIPSISEVAIRFIILLMLQIGMLFITKSYEAIIVILFAFLGALLAAGLNHIINREPLYNITNILIPGIFIGMLLPQSYPPLVVFVISAFTIFISRSIVFKGINNWLNIAPLAIIVAWFIGKEYFPPFQLNTSIIALRNSSVYLIENGVFPIYSFDSTITNFLNKYIFNFFNVTVPEGFISMMWDTHSMIPAFRFNIITIISSIIIFSDKAFSLIIPSVFLTVYLLFVRLFGTFLFGGYFNQGDMILALFTSGILFCATFLIQWYGTIPVTWHGKLVLGIISGITAFVLIGSGTSPVGMVFTVIISNICCMLIRIFEEKNNDISTGKVLDKLSLKMQMEPK